MDRIWENWREGGWGMWPILLFGTLAVLGAARFAWRGEHRLTGFVRWMTFTTGSSAVLGFITGMMATFSYLVFQVPESERGKIMILGTRESSSCLAFGLVMTTLIGLLMAIGYRRFPASDGA